MRRGKFRRGNFGASVLRPAVGIALAVAVLAPPAHPAAKAAGDTVLRVGAAKIDITWRLGTAGLTALHTRPYARAIVIDGPQSTGPLAVARADVNYVTGDLYESVVQKVEEATGIPPEHVLIAATHTHSAPNGAFPHVGQGGGTFDPHEKEFIATGIAEAIIQASANTRPATLGVGSGSVVLPTYNRRHTDQTGVSDSRAPHRVDPEVGVLRFDDAESGDPIAVIMNHGLHPVVVLENKKRAISSDFVGLAERATEESLRRRGVEPMAMFINGAVGDQNPAHVKGTFAEAEWTARALAEEAVRVAERLRPEALRKATVAEKLIPLPDPAAPRPDDLSDGSGLTPGPRVVYPAAPLTIPSSVRLQVISLVTDSSETALLSWPGEPIRDIGVHVKQEARALGFDNAFIIGLANDWAGYWLTEAEYDRFPWDTSTFWERALAFYGRTSWRYVTAHLLDLADHLHNGSTIEPVALPANAIADRALTVAIAGVTPSPQSDHPLRHSDPEEKVIQEPVDSTRLDLVSVMWRGGSPDVTEGWIPRLSLQRRVGAPSGVGSGSETWVTVAQEGTGDILVESNVAEEGNEASPSTWRATWQPLLNARPGWYRFVIEGVRRKAPDTYVPYDLISRTFRLSPCSCLSADPLITTADSDGAVELAVGAWYPGRNEDFSRLLPGATLGENVEHEMGANDVPATVSFLTPVTSGVAVVEAVRDGAVIGTLELRFSPDVRPITKHVLTRPSPRAHLHIPEATEHGKFRGTWTDGRNVSFRLVRVVDAFGNSSR